MIERLQPEGQKDQSRVHRSEGACCTHNRLPVILVSVAGRSFFQLVGEGATPDPDLEISEVRMLT